MRRSTLQGNSLEQCRKELHTGGSQVTDLQGLQWHGNCSSIGGLSRYGATQWVYF